VHAEQLAARAGQVRCGKCSRVFDALEHLIEETAPARAPRPKPEFEAMRADAADAEPAPESATREAPDIGATAQEPVIAQAADVVADAPEAGAETSEAAILLEPAIAEPANAEPMAASGSSSFDFGPVAAAEPDKPGRRWPWLLGALLLLLILLAQAAYHYRSAVTLLFPKAKPYAVALCATLGCELPLPRRIELMSIEASDLQADTTNPNVMVLSATLKNRAIFNQQHPLLELTLTDAQDQPVVRRVLAPQDYLGKAVNTQTGFAANTEIAIKVFIEGSQVKATGYRLYLFYS
jgi:hypothetical protein